MINKIAIANRGEIAVRLLSTCEEMGLNPVLLYSSADENSLACRMSKEKICIGPADSLKSYLNVSAVIEGALSAGAQALHPGYGFLSESAELAKACENNDISFIGPSEKCLNLFGDKMLARKQAQKCGLPVVPGFFSVDSFELLQFAKKIGFPVMIKSAKGGGGRGLRIVHSEAEWDNLFASASREAKQACGSPEIFVEKYLASARHIEVQVFADCAGQVHYLFDRDCSTQRKHQKVIEEAPASHLLKAIQQEMASVAVKLLQSVDYRQAGTVEFLYHDKKFYFMEVNPRLQVECPVTELILGIDLVKAQILTAQGFPAFVSKNLPIEPRGHSIQCRIYAEDMKKGVPVSGSLGTCYFPHGSGRRFDMGYDTGDEVSGFYDSMIGKIIVWAEDRISAIQKMKWTLKNTIIFGLKTNINFLLDFMDQERFIKGEIDTKFVEREFLKSWKEPSSDLLDIKVLEQVRNAFKNSPLRDSKKIKSVDKNLFNPWQKDDQKKDQSV